MAVSLGDGNVYKDLLSFHTKLRAKCVIQRPGQSQVWVLFYAAARTIPSEPHNPYEKAYVSTQWQRLWEAHMKRQLQNYVQPKSANCKVVDKLYLRLFRKVSSLHHLQNC